MTSNTIINNQIANYRTSIESARQNLEVVEAVRRQLKVAKDLLNNAAEDGGSGGKAAYHGNFQAVKRNLESLESQSSNLKTNIAVWERRIRELDLQRPRPVPLLKVLRRR